MVKSVTKLDINVGRHSYKVLLFCPYLTKFEFPTVLLSIPTFKISRKFIQREPSSCMHMDGETDVKLIVVFRNFAKSPKRGVKREN